MFYTGNIIVRAASTYNTINLQGGAPNVLDGVRLKVGDRVLVKDQNLTMENRIYIVFELGSGNNGIWIKENNSLLLDVETHPLVTVEEGVMNSNSIWVPLLDNNRTIWRQIFFGIF